MGKNKCEISANKCEVSPYPRERKDLTTDPLFPTIPVILSVPALLFY